MMKQLLFVSQSQLAHNLVGLVLPLVPIKIKLHSVFSVDDIAPAGPKFQLCLIDDNISDYQRMATLARCRLARTILLSPPAKPFLPETLAELIDRGLRS